MNEIWLRTGEATVLAAEGQFTDAMPEVMIGSIRGPVGHPSLAWRDRRRAIPACSSSEISTRWFAHPP